MSSFLSVGVNFKVRVHSLLHWCAMEGHSEHLNKVSLVTSKPGLKLKLSECSSALSEVKLLAHVTAAISSVVNSTQTAAIRDVPVLKDYNIVSQLS